jgi:Tol biopolymer transport system component
LEGGEPELFSDRLGIDSPDFSLRALLVGQQTVVERISDGQRWTIPNGGRLVSFSPDGKHLGWVAGEAGPPFDTARREIWISNIDGSEARLVRTLTGGSLSGWFPDGDLLVSGRLDDAQFQQAYWKLSISNASQESSLRELVRGERLRSGLLSPDGRWLVYAVTFSGDASQDGLWLLDVETLEKRRLDFFGAYRWRDAGRLLFVPLDLNQNQHALWQFDTSNGAMQPLITPETMPVKIAGGDWAVSPDGQKVVFLSAADQNLWLIEFP